MMSFQQLSKKVLKGLKDWVVSFEVAILVGAMSVFVGIETTTQNVFAVAALSLLAYISWKVREGVEALWWVSASSGTNAEKSSHIEMRSMFLNEQAHEMLRQILQYFQTYNPAISPISWFIDKIRSELCAFRMACLRRNGHEVSTVFEALAIRYIQQRIMRDFQVRNLPTASVDEFTATLAHQNWFRFQDWIEHATRTEDEIVLALGQVDPLRRGRSCRELEREVIQTDGLTYLWSFGKQPGSGF